MILLDQKIIHWGTTSRLFLRQAYTLRVRSSAFMKLLTLVAPSAAVLVPAGSSGGRYGEAARASVVRERLVATMNRRRFLIQAAGMVEATVARSSLARALQTVSSKPEVLVTLDPATTLATIPSDFIGLGYEISSVSRPGFLLSSQDSVYVQLVQTLGRQGVIRVGGNTSDYASYSARGEPLSSPEEKAGSVVNGLGAPRSRHVSRSDWMEAHLGFESG